jgi:hypothetical protein
MPATTIGFIGGGVLSQRMIRAALDDQLKAIEGDTYLYLPITKDHFSDEVMAVADWAIKNKVPYEAITDTSTSKLKVAAEYVEAATDEIVGDEGVVPAMVEALKEATGGKDEAKLFIFWDDADDEAYTAFVEGDEAGLPCFDLCNGVERLTFDDGEDEPEEEEPEPEEDDKHALDEAAEMGRRTVKDLKAELVELGVTLRREGKGRIAKGPHVAALMGYRETGFKAWKATPDGESAEPDEAVDDPVDEVAEAEAQLEAEEAAESAEEDVEVPEEDEAVEIPSADEEEAVVIPEDDTDARPVATQSVRRVDPFPMGVGNCLGCGGPIFVKPSEEDDWPEVMFYHAANCPLG